MNESPYPPVAMMLPHRDPFLFIQSVRDFSVDRIVCRGMVEVGHYLSSDGEAPPVLGVEMGAQAAGVHAALLRRETEATDSIPRAGYLVGIRQARFHAKGLPVGCALCVEGFAQGASGPLAIYQILVREEGEEDTLVEAKISTWAAEEPGP